ncbi:Fic family protein [Methanocalculus natronophilus]|uniref:Fic family protein n=1 Tax=Methanocalculus natronophilus TaxID=1262400 RepID=UPI0031B649B3
MTTPADLSILLQEGEGVTLEYKERVNDSFARELVAFANTAGGRVLLGVRDDGTVKGISDTNDLRARIQDIARKCDPPVKVLLERIGEVTVVTVRESTEKPVQCSDGFFWRLGAVSQKLSRNEIRDLFQQEGAIRFDHSVCTRFSYPEDFDTDKFRNWLGKSSIYRDGSVEDVLVNIEAAERSGGRLLFRNAGVLFFAKEPRRFFNQAYITCLLFKGTVKVHILDRKDFDGGIIADIEDALRFIERNTRTAYRIEKLQREDIPEYPMAALREAITNAVMHRDWFLEGANVFVEIFTDRIEVSSPGGLPKGMQVSDLGHKSVRRNPLIADLLHRIAYIEKAGTGIKRMRDGATTLGYPAPEFRSDSFFSAIFYPMPIGEMEKAGEETGRYHASTPQVPRRYPASTPQVVNILQAACDELKSRDELQEAAELKDRENFRKNYLKPLLEDGFLEPMIPDKPSSSNQRYRTTAAGRAFIEAASEEKAGEKTRRHPASNPQVPRRYPAGTPQVVNILQAARDELKSRDELQEAAGLKDRENFRKNYLKPLFEDGLLEPMIPDKPSSSKQRYRTTAAGLALIEAALEEEER